MDKNTVEINKTLLQALISLTLFQGDERKLSDGEDYSVVNLNRKDCEQMNHLIKTVAFPEDRWMAE